MASKDFKAPPTLNEKIVYSTWKKELKIWEAFTSIEKKKQAPAIFLTLSGQAREAVLEIDLEKLASDDGVKNLVAALDELYLVDETCSAYEAYEAFEKFVRPSEMTISDYIIHFERLYNKAKSHSMEIHEGVLAYRLLNSANLSENHKQLVRATLSEMKYNKMKDQLKKVFSNVTSNRAKTKEDLPVKIEPNDTFYGSSVEQNHSNNSEELFYANNDFRRERVRGPNQPFSSRGRFHSRGTPAASSGRGSFYDKRNNPLDMNGQISRCNICDSKFHWSKECPDSYEAKKRNEKKL